MRPWDARRFQDAVARYEASIDSVVRTVGEGSRGDEVYLKNLELAAKSLDRQARQLQQLVSGAPDGATELLNRLVDAVDLARDEVSARQTAFRDSEASR
ncbi:MAG: hypothetical protein IT282_11735, partial [Bacteroidetes bacterium]|nr:hypothetical protein [Bacteroidota bacterium]